MSRALREGAAAAALLLAAGAPVALGADQVKPGAYCPFPQEGETRECLEPARAEYREFFAALDGGAVGDAELTRVEADVAAGARSANAYLALSSLSYGYYRLAQRAAAAPDEDPAVIERLERWNALLAGAYEASPDDESYRDAVHQAALDLHERAPRVRLRCTDENGNPARCDSTEAIVRSLSRQRDETGVRGAVGRLLKRVLRFGGF